MTGTGSKRLAMRSQINWAVLGLVIERPSHGYAIHQRLEDEYQDLLSASDGHVYRALDGLESRGLIEEVPGSGVRTADKRRRTLVRRATQEGVRSFQERLCTHQMSEDRRQSWMFLRQLAVFAHEPEIGLQIIARLEQEYAEEARTVPITALDDANLGVVRTLMNRMASEEKRLAVEAKLPLIRFLRREFEELAFQKARRNSG